MLSLGFSRALTSGGFEHRATIMPGGRVVYRLADGSGHVDLPLRDWRALGERFQAETKAIVRRATISTVWMIPGLALYMIVMGSIAYAIDSSTLGGIGAVGFLIMLLFGPPVIYLWQSHRVQRIAAAIEAELARHPRVEAPPAVPWRVPRALEIAALVLIGPHLIVQVYGSFFPDAFRNTPWTGMHLNWSGIAGFAVLAILVFFRWRARGQEQEARESQGGPEPALAGRRVDVIARVRRDAD